MYKHINKYLENIFWNHSNSLKRKRKRKRIKNLKKKKKTKNLHFIEVLKKWEDNPTAWGRIKFNFWK